VIPFLVPALARRSWVGSTGLSRRGVACVYTIVCLQDYTLTASSHTIGL